MPPVTSPHIELIGVFDAVTGAPVTGAAGSITFDYYRDDTGATIPAGAPTITEVGSGLYKFTPNFPTSAARSVVYMVNTGSGHSPQRYWRMIRPEDFDEDKIKTLLQVAVGKWRIFTSGGNNNKMLIYDADGTTVLYTFDLFDASGNPVSSSPYQRIPE